MQAVEDRVAVDPVEACEELGAQSGWRRAPARDRWGPSPMPARGRRPPSARRPSLARPRRARRAHASLGDQFRRALAVALRPAAARAPRRESHEPEALVERGDLAVDPAEAERGVDRLGAAHARDPRALLRELQPDPGELACERSSQRSQLPRSRIARARQLRGAVKARTARPRGPAPPSRRTRPGSPSRPRTR